MSFQASYTKKVFHFNFDARTSRGRMKDKASWFIKVWDNNNPEVVGIGECGPLPGLSVDDGPELEEVLQRVVEQIKEVSITKENVLDVVKQIVPSGYPSIVFGLETSLLDVMNGGKRVIYENAFQHGQPISINGLVWMGDLDQMLQQASIKIQDGFRCIKVKVGGLNFEKECDILHYIRRKYFRDDIIIRLDANGAFKVDEALYKLNELAKFNIHSIEQPIKPGLPEMEELCRKSPIPIAFDEELIGFESFDEKERLLTSLKPQYIILKPTLHGGFASCKEWIDLAEKFQIGWWITSALESNIGLNAICQFTANYKNSLHQGLGTGMLYDDNIPSPLQVKKGEIFLNPKLSWDISDL